VSYRNVTRLALSVVAVLGCTPQPPAAPAPHTAMSVNASFGRTWDALIDDFAGNNIPIKTIDRTSGLIATDKLSVAASLTDAADCGTNWDHTPALPTDVEYNALVRGDSSHSTIRVTARWTRTGQSRVLGDKTRVTEECSTRATWETSLEDQIKKSAEGAK